MTSNLLYFASVFASGVLLRLFCLKLFVRIWKLENQGASLWT